MTLQDGSRQALLRRETSFALLPPDTRNHRDQSPFGTYDFSGAHYTCGDYDKTGPLFVKLGMHYGMFNDRAVEARRKYGLVKGNEPQITSKSSKKTYDSILAANPDLPPMALIFHETSISGKHITRVPDVFTDRPAYTLDQDEEAKFKTMWDLAVGAARTMRQNHPAVKLALGNGPLPTKEELLRRKFPAELFDSAGNESRSFGHPPEAQPPDWLANNASLWMDRQMLDAYGYRDKPLTQCHEVCYLSTNPGNLDFKTQADYYVRHAMHSLAWGVPVFRPGLITDVGGNYRWSHWGSAGFCHMYPELNVKPAFVAFATMTLMLDGAKFVRDVPLGSPSLYGVEFARPDSSQIFVLWTLRGRRPVTLSLDGCGAGKARVRRSTVWTGKQTGLSRWPGRLGGRERPQYGTGVLQLHDAAAPRGFPVRGRADLRRRQRHPSRDSPARHSRQRHHAHVRGAGPQERNPGPGNADGDRLVGQLQFRLGPGDLRVDRCLGPALDFHRGAIQGRSR